MLPHNAFYRAGKAAEGHPPKNPLSGSHTVSDERRPEFGQGKPEHDMTTGH